MKTKPIKLLFLFSLLLVIFSCEKDDISIETKNSLKTVALSDVQDRLLKIGSNTKEKSAEENYITYISEKISYEDLSNTEEELAVIEVTTHNKELYSRIIMLEFEGELQTVVVGLNPFENTTETSFSGEMLITDLEGEILKAFIIDENAIIQEFIGIGKRAPYHGHITKKNFTGEVQKNCLCGMSNCNWCGELDEVIITAPSETPSRPFIPLTHAFPHVGGDGTYQGSGKEWDLGGSGGGYLDNSPDPVEEEDPTPCETALLSRDVYSTEDGQQEFGTEPIPQELSGGWELNNTLDLSSLTLTDNDSGFNSAVYQKLVNGVYQYMYVTEGTDPISIIDWYNNVRQVSGNSEQYEISVQNAQLLNSLVGSRQLYFSGHSLGGGLASVNSLATGRSAFTYNAAGISSSTRNLYDNGLNPEINATVVEGEIIDRIQDRFGIQAEDSNTINYIEEESTYWEEFINDRSPALNTYRAGRLHMIETVLDILDCL